MLQISLLVPFVLIVRLTNTSVYLDLVELVQPPVVFFLIQALVNKEMSRESVLLAIVDFYDFLLHQPADFETGLRLEHSSAASNIGKTHQTSRFALPSLTLDFAGSDSLPLPYTISYKRTGQ
jgi:hypothetical protein